MKQIMIIVLLIATIVIIGCVGQGGIVGQKGLRELPTDKCDMDKAAQILFKLVKADASTEQIQRELVKIGCQDLAYNSIEKPR